MDDKKFPSIGTPLCGLIFGVVGALIALMLLYMGLWRTLFVVVLFAAGYFLGASANKQETIKRWINRLFPPKNE